MDGNNHGQHVFHEDFIGPNGQYTPGVEHEMAFFSSPSDMPVSGQGMPIHFQQEGAHFPDMNAAAAQQAFRNGMAVAQNRQIQESHENFLAHQQQFQASLYSRQMFEGAQRAIPQRAGPPVPPPPPPPAAKKPEDPDSACRPRLTPEQTQFLEEIFSHTPRPTTQQKRRHAIELGLTHEKVNNWFQNRRAKSKQMTRIRRELSILTPGDMQMAHLGENVAAFSANGLSSPLHLPEDNRAIMSIYPTDEPSHSAGSLDGSWNTSSSNSVSSASYNGHDNLSGIQNIGLIPGMMRGDLAPQSSQDAVFSALGETPHEDWTFDPSAIGGQRHSAVDVEQLMMSLHQPHNSTSHFWDGSVRNDENLVAAVGAMKQEASSLSPQTAPSSIAAQTQPNSAVISQQPTPQKSPSPKLQAVRPQPGQTSNAFRRDSTTSEVTNGINTIHLQNLPLNTGSDEEIFKTPKIPNLNLAARRKRERPAALQPMRTVSSSTIGEAALSSSNSTVVPASAVRRIKSAGNSLNAFSRVQKSGASSAQRSPLSQTFRDAGVLEKLQTQMIDLASSNSSNDPTTAPPSSNPSPEAHVPAPWAPSPADSLGAAPPPLSASYTHEEPGSWAGVSPPITPLYKPAFFGNCSNANGGAGFPIAEVPQSAPAHITAFPNLSPPPSGMPVTSTTYYTPAVAYVQGNGNAAAHGTSIDQQDDHTSGSEGDTAFWAPVPVSAGVLGGRNHILKSYDGSAEISGVGGGVMGGLGLPLGSSLPLHQNFHNGVEGSAFPPHHHIASLGHRSAKMPVRPGSSGQSHGFATNLGFGHGMAHGGPISVGPHYGFFSAVAPGPAVREPPKELDIIMVPFPTPESRPRSLPRQGGGQGGVWSFQNTGPKDYAGSD